MFAKTERKDLQNWCFSLGRYMGLCGSKSSVGGDGGGSRMRRGGASFLETPDTDPPSFSIFLNNCSAASLSSSSSSSSSSSTSPLTPRDSPPPPRNRRTEASLEVASNKLLLLQGVRKTDDAWSFVPPHFAIAEWRRSSSRETSSLRGTSLLEESRSKEVEVQAMTPNLKSTTQLDHQGKKKMGVEKELCIKGSPLKQLNSNVLYSVPGLPLTKMPVQAVADNGSHTEHHWRWSNNSRAAMDRTSLGLANSTHLMKFASDENSTTAADSLKLMKSLLAILHEEHHPQTDLCQMHNSDAPQENKNCADRKESVQFSSPVTTMVQMNPVIPPVSGYAPTSSVMVKDHVTYPSLGAASLEDSVLCIELPTAEQIEATSRCSCVVRGKVSEEVSKASHSEEGAEEVSPHVKSRKILTQLDDCSVEDEQKKNMIVDQHHHNSRAGLDYSLSEVQDFDDVTGDQITFIEIVLNAESGGFVTEMTTVCSNRSAAEKPNQQEGASLLSEGVKPRKIQGKNMDLGLGSDTISTLEVGEDCHWQAQTHVMQLENGDEDTHGSAAVRNKILPNSREICIQGFDAHDNLQLEGESAVKPLQDSFAEKQCQVPIEQHPTLQITEKKETSPSEFQLLGISVESIPQYNLPLLQIQEVPTLAYVPECFISLAIPDARELEHDRHLSSKNVTDVYGGSSRECEVAAKIKVGNHSPVLQKLVETADTTQLDLAVPVLSCTCSDRAEDVNEFPEADKLSECVLASFTKACPPESDNAGSSADLEADNMSQCPAGVHALQAFLEQMITSKDESYTQMDCVASCHLQDEEFGGNLKEAAVRADYLHGSSTTTEDNIADPLSVTTPSSTTPSTPQLSRDTSSTISGASTQHLQLTTHLLPGVLSAEEIAEIWRAVGDSLSPFSASSTP